jgi:hypothetical protein
MTHIFYKPLRKKKLIKRKLSTCEEILPEKETREILSVTSVSIILKGSKHKDLASSSCVNRNTSIS